MFQSHPHAQAPGKMPQFHGKQVHDSLQLHSSLLTDSKCAEWQTSPFSWETNRINPVWHSFLFQQIRLSTWSGKYCCFSHDLVFFFHEMICKQSDGNFHYCLNIGAWLIMSALHDLTVFGNHRLAAFVCSPRKPQVLQVIVLALLCSC